ncbi:Zinc finger, RING-type [Dillenia turbinata]|uniref:RING-type E3 ubiquitin transferase n=1 Tax=Dillenia turbinata TaxID=194707 RepID=A0AAN8UKU1_9MAGN
MGDSPSSELRDALHDSTSVELTGKIMVGAIIVLFLVVAFVVFLHIYAKLFWYPLRGSTASSGASRERRRSPRQRLVFAAEDGGEAGAQPQHRGLDPSVLKSLAVVTLDSKQREECAVCLSEMVEGVKVRMLPKCNHCFHLDCIDMWFHIHSTCPLCRNPIVTPCSDSVVIQILPDPNSPNFPTNVLFWGNETRVTTATVPGGEGRQPPSPSPPAAFSSSTTPFGNLTADTLTIIPTTRQMEMDGSFLTTAAAASPSPSTTGGDELEAKSPTTSTRLRSLRRLLSSKRVTVPSVSCSAAAAADVEQV